MKKRISNLYTSFEKTRKGHLLTAYYGLDVDGLMGEILKFPTMYGNKDLASYIGAAVIIPKKKNPIGKFLSAYSTSGLEFISEKRTISPKLLPLSGIESDYVYFTFKQLFEENDVRKYEFELKIIDLSIKKALELKERALRILSIMDNAKEIRKTKQFLNLCDKLQGITGSHKDLYDKVQRNNFLITDRTYNLLRREIMNDLRHIDQTININQRNFSAFANTVAFSRMGSPIKSFNNEFGEPVRSKLKQNLSNNIEVFDGRVNNPSNDYLFTSRITIPTTNITNIPEFNNKFEKSYREKDTGTLNQKAQNLNLDFSCTEKQKIEDLDRSSIEIITSQEFDDVYVLVNHSNANVTCPNFVLLADLPSNLLNNSTYLCKTHYVDSENQYFLLGT